MSSSATSFDLAPVWERLREEAYALLAASPLFALAVIVVVLAWLLGGWMSRRALLARTVSRKSPFLRELAITTVRWTVLLAGVLVALEILDATALVGAVLGTAGVLGVALGFAFKDILENYLAGILMSLRQPFSPRDHVVIAGNEGLVVALNSRATILMTLDGNHLRLPNALVFRGVTLNYTRNPTRRFEFDIGIGVNDDLVRAQKIGVAEMRNISGVTATPPPRAIITALGDSSVQMRYQGWVDQRHHDFLLVRSEAIRRVKLVLEAAGMDLPEPIYRVQLSEHTPARALAAARSGGTAAGVGEGIDTGAHADVLSQLEAERHQLGADDLLDPAAPKE
jgi:small conductance mechanosensitive channel